MTKTKEQEVCVIPYCNNKRVIGSVLCKKHKAPSEVKTQKEHDKEGKYCKTCYNAGFNQGKVDVMKIIDEEIKMWESDNKGQERYYGASGCVVKVLEELKAKLQEIK